MPDDIEILRLRALAKAKAERERAQTPTVPAVSAQPQAQTMINAPPTINQAFNAPSEALNQSMSEFKGGNIPAGVLDFGNFLQRGITMPLSVSAAGWRKVPYVGDFVAKTLEAPGQILNTALYEAPRAVFSPFVGLLPKSVQNLGQSPENAQQTTRASGEFASGATQLVGGALVGGLAGATKGLGGVETPSPIAQKLTSLQERRATAPIRKANVALDRAFPAQTKELTRPDDKQRLAPYLAEEERKNPVQLGDVPKGGTKPSVARQIAEEKVPDIKKTIYNQQDEVIQRNSNLPLVGGVNEVANNVESLRNIYTQNVDVLKDKSILDEAAKYRNMGEITLSQARELQKSLNAGLQELYKKSNESQVAAENLGKPVAEMKKAAESLREQIVRTLDNAGEDGNWYREKSLDYGAAVRIEAAAERNIVKSEAPLPPMFTERGSTVYPSRPGITREIMEHTVGKLSTPDKLARKAMRKYGQSNLKPVGPAPPPTFPRPMGLLPSHPIEMGMGPDATSIRITPAMVHPEIARKLLPSPGYGKPMELPAQFPNEIGGMNITTSRLQPIIDSFGGKKYTTIHAQRVGSALNLNEAIEAFDKWKRGEYPAVHANQFYKEVAEGFLEDKFRGVDKKSSLKAYSPQQIQTRLDWLKRGIPTDQFPLESRIK